MNYLTPTYEQQVGGRERLATNGGYAGQSWQDFSQNAAANGNFQRFSLSDDPGANPFFAINPQSAGSEYFIAPDPDDENRHILMVPGADGKVTQMSVPKVNPAQMKMIAASLAVMGGGMAYGGAFSGAGAGATSGASGVGTSAAGAGELGIADTIAGGLAEAGTAAGGAASYAVPSYEAATAAAMAGAGGGGGNALSGFLSGAKDFLSNPLTQAAVSGINGYIGNKAADKAADAQVSAANAAQAEIKRQYDQTRTDLAPWRERGGLAANRMSEMMGLSGKASDPYYGKGIQTAPTYTPPAPGPNRISQMLQVLNQRTGVK